MVTLEKNVVMAGRARSTGRRAGSRVGVVSAAAVAILLMLAGPAAAHPTLLISVPAAGFSGGGPVGQVVLAFDESVTATDVKITGTDGRPVPSGPVEYTAGGRQVVLRLEPALTSGQFRVHWQVTASDGDLVGGTFAFGIATAAPPATSTRGTAALAATATLRWLLFSALAVATGGLLAERLARRAADGSGMPVILAPLRAATAIGFLAAAGLTGLLMAAGGGWSALSSGPAAGLVVIEAAGFAAAFTIAVVASRLPRLRQAAGLPLTGVLIAEGLRAHPGAYLPGWGAVLTVVHLAAAALWAGALLHVVRTAAAWRGGARRGQVLLLAYAPVALGLYLLVAGTGILAAVLVLDHPSDLFLTSYGRVLAGKLALVAAITALAALGRLRVHRLAGDMAASDAVALPTADVSAVTLFERWLLLIVLAASAVLVTLPAPRPTTTALALPPRPEGPVAAFGTLVGQLSLGATASTGQLQLALSAPGSEPGDNAAEGGALANARVTAALQAPGTGPATLAVRRCGSGCFLAAAGWREGTNRLTVSADLPDWHGGTTTFSVPWPPIDASDQFQAMITALRATSTLDLTEATTSDTTGRTYPTVLQVSSAEFLQAEPYGKGDAPVVTALPPRPQEGLTRIAIGFPTIGVYIQIALDGLRRPVTEIEATPNHLITRTFRYPRA